MRKKLQNNRQVLAELLAGNATPLLQFKNDQGPTRSLLLINNTVSGIITARWQDEKGQGDWINLNEPQAEVLQKQATSVTAWAIVDHSGGRIKRLPDQNDLI